MYEIRELCKKYNVKENDYEKVVKISELLKDADALDRARFAKGGALEPAYLRSQTAKKDEMLLFAKKVNGQLAQEVLERNYGKKKWVLLKL